MNTPQNLDVDDDNVYFTDTGDNSIWRIPKGGGTVVELAAGQNNPTFLALDEQYVYWNNAGALSIARVPKAGGVVETVVTTSATPVNVAVDATNVYWVAEPVPDNAGFYSAPKAGGGSETLLNAPVSSNGSGLNMRADSARLTNTLMYADSGGARLWSAAGSLLRGAGYVLGRKGELGSLGSVDNGAFNILSGITDIASDSCARYILVADAPEIRRAFPQSMPEAVASAVKPRHIAADEQFVYWTEGRTVRRAATGDNRRP